MGSATLASLITRARSRADMPIAGFVTEAEVTSWLNEGAQQVHEKLVTAYGEEYLSTRVKEDSRLAASLAVSWAERWKTTPRTQRRKLLLPVTSLRS